MINQKYFNKLCVIQHEKEFEKLALEVFTHQSKHNKIYSEFIHRLNIDPNKINSINDLPFLPIEFFKSHVVMTGDEKYQKEFISSGTTSDQKSRHFVSDIKLYENVFYDIFNRFYGKPDDYTILALLPSYMEREGSSIIYMMEKIIKRAAGDSGFYLNDFENLHSILEKKHKDKKKTILFGVTFALLDFVAYKKNYFPELIVMETGGMKGRRREMIRNEVHEILCGGFGVKSIHSEYGMTELLSQAYSKENGIFKTPPWMKILIRDPYDPVNLAEKNSTGGINIIDLANINSCAFLATQDVGRLHDDGAFEVLGRFDFSDVRGCNLMLD